MLTRCVACGASSPRGLEIWEAEDGMKEETEEKDAGGRIGKRRVHCEWVEGGLPDDALPTTLPHIVDLRDSSSSCGRFAASRAPSEWREAEASTSSFASAVEGVEQEVATRQTRHHAAHVRRVASLPGFLSP